ncbi:MAG TPA: hypothetical protein VG754_07360 [Verrucomicrobiae bacterium]|nr:hypothetical protein [Verrucomicrobiae bacterium]
MHAADTNAPPAKEEPRITRDTNGNVVVKVDAATQKLIAFKVQPLAAAQLAPELKAYGRVLDPAPLVALMNELASAQASYEVSSNELARLKNLSASGNASARALQAAEAAELHDRLTTQSARDRLVLAWGKWVVDQPDMPAFIQDLTALSNALIRVDLSAAQHLAAQPLGARVVALSGLSANADVLGRAPGVDPQIQGQGIVLQVKTNESHFLVGEAVTGFLKTPGDTLSGVIVPRSAVVRANGAAWVYAQTADEQFTRKEIALDHPVEGGWFVTEGVAAGDKLVIAGAQTLLSEELKGAFGPPD